jgi:tetratricopeptide (TPR) repeat protein
LLIGALALWRRAPLAAFGILFYYLAHLVESGPIPITDLAFEHRAYLPDAGLIIAVVAVLGWASARFPVHLLLLPMSLLLIVAATALTFERNQLWRDPIAFLTHETEMSPEKERVWTSLGKELMRRGRFEEALKALGTALNLARTEDGLEVQPATLINAVMALHYTRQHKKAFQMARMLQVSILTPVERSRLFEVRGMALLDLKRPELARKELMQAIKNFPNANAEAGLAHADLLQGDSASAQRRAQAVLQQDPGNAIAANVLAQARKKAP